MHIFCHLFAFLFVSIVAFLFSSPSQLRFPQIFGSERALAIDPSRVAVEPMHWELALRALGPAAQRVSATVFPKPLSRPESLALARPVREVAALVAAELPAAPAGNLLPGVQFSPTVGEKRAEGEGKGKEEEVDEKKGAASVGAGVIRVDTRELVAGGHRPRLLVDGPPGCGQVREEKKRREEKRRDKREEEEEEKEKSEQNNI